MARRRRTRLSLGTPAPDDHDFDMESSLGSDPSSHGSSGYGSEAGLEEIRGDIPEDQTMKSEMKHLERRYNSRDEKYISEVKAENPKSKPKNWWRLSAFCHIKHYDRKGEVETTRIYVNPEPLRQLCFDVIGLFPSDPIDLKDVQIEEPFHSLFYYRDELEKVGRERFVDDKESLGQLEILLDWIGTHFELDSSAHKRCVSSDRPAISHDRLWTIFPPKTIAYCRILDKHRAFSIKEVWYDDGANSSTEASLRIRGAYVDFDGKYLGTCNVGLAIKKYPGTRELSELEVMPLDLHESVAEVKPYLLERGRKFEAMAGQHYMEYVGQAVMVNEKGQYIRVPADGRVMIDANTSVNRGGYFEVKPFQKKVAKKRMEFAPEREEYEKLSDEQAIRTNATVRGYSFTTKRFLEFFVDGLEPVKWNPDCFNELVIDPTVKETIRALVSTHIQNDDREGGGFDDIIKGKGQGVICVLHGNPGCGKTLTAETVAEFVKRPLYMVSSGDLGTCSTTLDRNLSAIMELAAEWKAVLLIDEADVFLQERSMHDLNRNAMVSVFLRLLEYYKGIMFLTTNRVDSFDVAFKSRIHIPIRYTDLDFDARRKIWQNFCGRVSGADISEKGFDQLAKHELNGRQIKNIVKAAESMATFHGVKLDLDKLLKITKIQDVFEKDMTNINGIDYSEPGSTKKNEGKHMFL
ncbi:hypothetical protein OQA88_3466 [Cercophora sp. LCS_1]